MSVSPSPASRMMRPMRRNPPTANRAPRFLIFTATALTLVALTACGGGGGSSTRITTGGGGGGGTPSANCTPPAAVTTAPAISSGVGKTVQPQFVGLHVGDPSLLSSVTIPYGTLRLWDTGTGWSQINTAPGVFDFTSKLDSFVLDSSLPAGVDFIYNLARTPTWASFMPNDSSCAYATIGGGNGQCWPPADLASDGSGTDADWIAWVTAVAQRNHSTYGDKIKYFEIWNEWNIPLFWQGSAAQLVRMEQDARCVISGPPAGASCNPNSNFPPGTTALDPAAKIITPSPVGAGQNPTTLAAVQTNLTNYFTTSVGGVNGGAFADAIGFHGYVGTQSSSDPCPTAENVIAILNGVNTAVTTNSAQASGKPWIDTEDGWSKAPDEGFTDPDRQAGFIVRYNLLQLSMGVDRSYFYRWDSPTVDASLWLGPSGPTSPAGTAYGELYKWTVGATLVSPGCTANGSVYTCPFTRSNGYQAEAVWDADGSKYDCLNGSCTTTSFTVPSAYTIYRDVTGTETPVSGGTVQIGTKPILLESTNLP